LRDITNLARFAVSRHSHTIPHRTLPLPPQLTGAVQAPARWTPLRTKPVDRLVKHRAIAAYRSQLPSFSSVLHVRIGLSEMGTGGELIGWTTLVD
jgi:hypothetical protein